MHDWSRDIAIAPEGALRRVAAAINRPKKRAFGILKTENEYVGFIRDDTFEIWERHQRAVHARGEIKGRRGGSRIAVRTALTTWSRLLLGVFFVLYAIAALSIASRPPDPAVSSEELAIAFAGAVALGLIFVAGARKQRSDLRALIERVFADAPRI